MYEKYSCAHLDNAVNTGGKERRRSAGDTERLEDGGGVIVDAVDTGQILTHHHAHADGKTVSNTLHSQLFELREPVGSMSPFLFMFELRAHIVDLIGDVFVIGGEIADV